MRQGLIAFILILALCIPLILRGGGVSAGTQITSTATAQEATEESTFKPAQPETLTPKKQIEYALPYPGILPDHPLYPLKVLRDRILEFLIRDPQRKADFYLLMADKRLNMGVMLTDKKKYELAESTVSKGEKYFLKGVEYMQIVSNNPNSISSGAIAAYKNSLLKHQEVIERLQKNSPESVNLGYKDSLKVLAQSGEKLQNLGNL